MHWKLKVSGYGKIKSAEIEAAPLTLFVGDNNSGKSYLMSLLWGIQNFGVLGLFGAEYKPDTKAAQSVIEWIKTQVASAWEKGKVLVKKSVGSCSNQQQPPISDIFYTMPIAFLSDCPQG